MSSNIAEIRFNSKYHPEAFMRLALVQKSTKHPEILDAAFTSHYKTFERDLMEALAPKETELKQKMHPALVKFFVSLTSDEFHWVNEDLKKVFGLSTLKKPLSISEEQKILGRVTSKLVNSRLWLPFISNSVSLL